ncbi:hypothetical protein AB4Z32_14125 [Massilia sp. 2TAF26]|uniref:hypothetical protein n=1 Tax=Massilia sp. 2TAF26 TaxID=3233012 RepID=UPI003F98E9F3
MQELFELPCLHAASVNGSGRHWTAGLQKRFHTWREQRQSIRSAPDARFYGAESADFIELYGYLCLIACAT